MSHAEAEQQASGTGLLLAALILLSWLASLVGLLAFDLSRWPWWAVLTAVLLRTVLTTGLFITAHDAMHRLLLPARPRWNDRLGALALALYAALPYASCRRNHLRHHRYPASARDPDFHGDPSAGPLRWYGRFMAGYLSPSQMGWLVIGWGALALSIGRASLDPATGLASPWIRVLLVCTLPLLLSSAQLFLFGTFLPHRVQRPPRLQGAPTSLNLPPWLSLLACYHFGYHREHHDHPGLAWFQLPAERRRARHCSGFRPLAPA